jgi:hypothetical protein
VAYDSTPGNGWESGDLTLEPAERRRLPPLRKLLVTVLVLAVLITSLVATGVVDATEHALAHAFPGLMIDGCGGG